MSQENVEVVRAAFQAFERGDMEDLLRRCDESIAITQDAELLGASREQHGHDGVLEAFAIWPELWDDFRVEILSVTDKGDQVMVRTLNHGRGKDSGAEVEMPFTFLFTLRAGKITAWRIFMREEDALEATRDAGTEGT
jgi:ketosteroid isomerase-like protein